MDSIYDTESGYDAYGGNYPESDWDTDPEAQPLLDEAKRFEIALVVAFVQGAKWCEYRKTGATMWQSDQDEAETEALKLAGLHTLGGGHNVELAGAEPALSAERPC